MGIGRGRSAGLGSAGLGSAGLGWAGPRSAGLASLVGLALAVAGTGAWTVAAGQGVEPTEEIPPSVEGRFAVLSEVGGAVWALQPGGQLIIVGPGELVAEGRWLAAAEPGAFDAALAVGVTGQELTVLGALSPDGQRIALHVRASDPRTPGDGVPWPPESRLTGERIGMVRPGPSPTATADECLRPAWETGSTVDWDPCGLAATETADRSVVPER
jgi:hypothetical protein